eukprot:271015_1
MTHSSRETDTSSSQEHISLLSSTNASHSTLPVLSLATSDLHDYNENTSLLLAENANIEMVEMPQTVSSNNTSDNSDTEILNNDSPTGLYRDKSATATVYADTFEEDLNHYQNNINNKTYPRRDIRAEINVVTQQCCQTICNPQITILKDAQGKHEGVLRMYGKPFSYKQIIGFIIFFISFALMTSAIGVNIWVFCEGTTASQHSILLVWFHDGLSISVGKKAFDSIKFKNIVGEVSHFDHDEFMQPLPTVFDEDYDYTKWPEIEKALHSQSDKRDLISLLEWSENNRIKDIEYRLNLMNIFNTISVCCLGVLMFVIILCGDNYYRFQSGLIFVTFVCIISSIIYWGSANQQIEQYNNRLWCHSGHSFIVLSTAMANLFLILFILVLPKRHNLYRYELKKHYHSVETDNNDQIEMTNTESKHKTFTDISTDDSDETLSQSKENAVTQSTLLESNDIKDSVHSKASSEPSKL